MVFAGCLLAPHELTPGHFSLRKGSILEGSEVRMIIINYAKKNDLVDADNKK